MALGTTNGTVTSQNTPSLWSSFFGSVTAGIGEGISKIGSEILPNWAQGELDQQKADQLQKETYAQQQKTVETAQSKPGTVFTVGGLSISWQTLTIGAVAIVGGLLLLKFVR